MSNELWSSRQDPEDLRIAELFDGDETLWVLESNFEPVVIRGGDGKDHQGFVMRFKCQSRDKTIFATRPMFFDESRLWILRECAFNEFEGFGVPE